jgi:undecaprenyl-diphosphatase
MKPYFGRLRPSQEPSLQEWIHLVEGYRGGKFGFASSHAANTFGSATFFFLWFRNIKRWVIWLFVWAAFMTYTRVYLGVHYPGDVLVGALVGIVCGWTAFKFSEWLMSWDERRRLKSSE